MHLRGGAADRPAAYELVKGKGSAAEEAEAWIRADAADETSVNAAEVMAQKQAGLVAADQALAEARDGLAEAERQLERARARLSRQMAQDRRPRREEQVSRALEAAAAAIKSARPVTYQDVLDAARPMTRPPVTTAAAPVRREDPRQVLKVLKNWQSPLVVPAAPARSWTPAELAALRAADKMTDPESRERIRSGLIARRDGSVT